MVLFGFDIFTIQPNLIRLDAFIINLFLKLLSVIKVFSTNNRILLLKIDKDLKLDFYFAVLLLSLTVGLRMKSSKQLLFNA